MDEYKDLFIYEPPKTEFVEKTKFAEKWINCNDYTPEVFVDVLVYCISNETQTYAAGDKYIAVDRYVRWNDGQPNSFSTDRFYGKVTHWMPLPKGPHEN